MVEIINDFNKLETSRLPTNTGPIYGILKHNWQLMTTQDADVYKYQYYLQMGSHINK